MVLPMYGVEPSAATLLMSRFFGVALLQVGLLLYFIRETRDAGTAWVGALSASWDRSPASAWG
jgi:vacuolar-type H+-ATPase subunit I/STV1